MYFDSITCIMAIIHFFCYANDTNLLIDNLHAARYIATIKNATFNLRYWETHSLGKQRQYTCDIAEFASRDSL